MGRDARRATRVRRNSGMTEMNTDESDSETFSLEQAMRSDRAERVGEVVGEKLDEIYEQGKGLYQQGKDRAQTIGSSMSDYVQDKPLTALLIAAGAGMFLGMLVSRR